MASIKYTAALFLIAFCVEVTAQDPANQPLEYIESSSPLPGGGVVTSISVPGQSGPTYNTNSDGANSLPPNTIREASLRQAGQQSGQSVLDRQLQPGTTASRQPAAAIAPQRTLQVPTSGYGVTQNTYQAPLVAQVPSLGVPTTLNRAMRPNCSSCNVNAPGYGGVAPPTKVYTPAASLPPTLGAQGQGYYQGGTMVPPQRSVYTPVVRLQNMPPNVYAGQGIIGSPKLYVDGQPIRNLMRYLIIP